MRRLATAALIALAAAGAFAPARAAAQQASVVVLRIEPGADPICSQIEQALSGIALTPDPGYYDEAGRRGLDPASEAAMAQLTPLIGVALAIVPIGADDAALGVMFRNGRNGQSMGEVDVPLTGGRLGAAGQRALLQETRARLTLVGGGGGAPPPGGGGGAPAAGGDDDTGYDGGDGDGEASGDDETALELRLGIGAGMGTRSVEWPTLANRAAVDLGAFPALEVSAGLWFLASESFAMGTDVVYQTSFGHEVDELHEGGSPRTMAIRSHRVGMSLVPELRFGDDHDMRLGFGVGYGVRSLRPAVHHLLTPDFSIGGPTVRLLVRIPFGGGVALTLAPEGQLLMQVSDELQVLGVESSGFAFGGEGALQIQLDGAFHLELTYRESHASLGSSLGDGASDVERFATARLLGVL